jgi:predicted NAD/FAD-dependent oxidoreductase
MLFYDIIVVGGGIAGIYQAWQRLKREPDLSLLLLEADARIGGRVFTFHNRHYPGVEFGAGRFHKKHVRLMALIRELGLAEKIVPIQGNKVFIPSQHTNEDRPQMDGKVLDDMMMFVLKRFEKGFSRTWKKKLQNITFLEYLKEVLDESKVQLIYDSFGYSSELTDMNAYDSVKLIRQYYFSQFYVLSGGMSQLVEGMTERLKQFSGFHVRTRHRVNALEYSEIDQVFSVGCEGMVSMYHAPKVVMAANKELLLKLPMFRPIHPMLRMIHTLPLCRIYSIFPKDLETGRVWFHDLPRVTTNNMLRYILPIDRELGIVMISYTDNRFARYWNRLYLEGGVEKVNLALSRWLRKTFHGIHIPHPTHTMVAYWEHGVAYYGVGFDSERMLPLIRRPFPDRDLWVRGENFSEENSQWVEGALDC